MGDLTKDQPLRAETRLVLRGAAMVGGIFAVLVLYQPASASQNPPTFSGDVVRILQQS